MASKKAPVTGGPWKPRNAFQNTVTVNKVFFLRGLVSVIPQRLGAKTLLLVPSDQERKEFIIVRRPHDDTPFFEIYSHVKGVRKSDSPLLDIGPGVIASAPHGLRVIRQLSQRAEDSFVPTQAKDELVDTDFACNMILMRPQRVDSLLMELEFTCEAYSVGAWEGHNDARRYLTKAAQSVPLGVSFDIAGDDTVQDQRRNRCKA